MGMNPGIDVRPAYCWVKLLYASSLNTVSMDGNEYVVKDDSVVMGVTVMKGTVTITRAMMIAISNMIVKQPFQCTLDVKYLSFLFNV